MAIDTPSRTVFPRPRSRTSGVSGAALVAFGAAASGLCAYVFLIVSARDLGPTRDASLATLWSLAFLAGPGFFLPFEQELARLTAGFDAAGVGPGRLLPRAFLVGGLSAASLVGLTLVFAGPITRRLFDGQPLLLVGFVLTLPGYLCMHLAWGLFAGNRRLDVYAVITATEGATRLIIGIVLTVTGVRSPGPFGLALGIAPFVAAGAGVLASQPRRHGSTRSMRNADVSTPDLTRAIAALLGGSLLNQFLLMASPIVVKVLGRPRDPTTSRFLAGMVLVRVPLFLFNAVLAALLPTLSASVVSGQISEFNTVLRRVTVGVTLAGVTLTAGAATIAPALLTTLFGSGYRLARGDLAILAAACSLYMVALVLSQGLIASSWHHLTTVAWAIGVATFLAFTAASGSLGLQGRVEWGFLVGCTCAAGAMGAMVLRLPAPTGAQPVAAPTPLTESV